MAWGLLAVATGAIALVYRARLSTDLSPSAPPPSEPAALLAWLTERAPGPGVSALADGAWPDVAGNTALARWARHRIDLDAASPAVLRGLAVHGLPEDARRRLTPSTGLDAEVVAVLLDPELTARVVAGCPDLGPRVGPTLCDGDARRRARARLEAAVGALFATDDPFAVAWGIELAIGLGSEGGALVDGLSLSDDRGRAAALIVKAWTLPPDAAEAALVAHARADDPLAVVAALELARLGRGDAALHTLQATMDRPADAALVSLAEEVAARRVPPPSPQVGLFGSGL